MTDTREQLYLDYLRLVAFTNSLLDPEKYGHSVSAEVRDAAREALGLPKVETKAEDEAAMIKLTDEQNELFKDTLKILDGMPSLQEMEAMQHRHMMLIADYIKEHGHIPPLPETKWAQNNQS